MTKPAKQPLPSLDPKTISRFKKERFLRAMTEDDFRDRVVRPLFLRRQLTDGRDLCGSDERGKDCIFFDEDKLGERLLYAVQTKKGNVNMSRKATENVEEAKAQLRTILATSYTLLPSKEKVYPNFAVLCASGVVNQAAREHIREEIKDPRVRYYDSAELIPEIDRLYPELWYGIDADVFPYLQRLKEEILKATDTISVTELGSAVDAPVTEDGYVTLYAYRLVTETKRKSGKVFQVPKLDEIPVHAILNRKDSPVVITGEAGSGKTTALRRLAFTLIEHALTSAEMNRIPIVMRAADLAACSVRLVDLAAETTARMSGTGKPAFSDETLRDGHLVLLIDALDEVPTDEGKQRAWAKIQAFQVDYPKCKIVITSRPTSFLSKAGAIEKFRYNLSPVNVKQAEKMITRLLKAKSLPAESTQEMLRRLQDVHGIELSPLLVTIFVATSDYSRKDIPANITELFKKFSEMMLGRWDEKKGLAQQYQAPLKDFLLKQVAFRMHERRQTSIPLVEFKRIIGEELTERGHQADTDILFDEIVYRSGLVRIDDEDVHFRHFLL